MMFSKLSIIFGVFVTVLSLVIFYIDGFPIFFSLLFKSAFYSFLIAWIVSYIVKDRRDITDMVFAFFMLVQILLHIYEISWDEYKVIQSESRVLEALDKYRHHKKEGNTEKQNSTAYKNFTNSLTNELMMLSETSKGESKIFYQVMLEFDRNITKLVSNWNNAHDQTIDLLDYKLLKNENEQKRVQSILNKYLKSSEEYHSYLLNIESLYIKRVKKYNFKTKVYKTIVSDNDSKKFLKIAELLNAHIEYANKLLNFLDFLNIYNQDWSYEDDTIIIDDNELIDKFNELVTSLLEQEKKIEIIFKESQG